MRTYYLCDPSGQEISGPHSYQELIRRARDKSVSEEWFVAEAGSNNFTPFAEAGILREILFGGAAAPVDPPPVGSFRLKGAPQPKAPAQDAVLGPTRLNDHHDEFTKVVEKSVRLQRPKLESSASSTPPKYAEQDLSPENILHAAREDLKSVLQKRDENNFNPPSYWESSAGERMKTFLYAEMFVILFALLILGAFFLFSKITIVLLTLLLGAVGMLTVGLAFLVFFMMS